MSVSEEMSSAEIARIIEAALARRAPSAKAARETLREMEARSRKFADDGDETLATLLDEFILLWVNRNFGFLSRAAFERTFRRVEARSPRGRAKRLFDLSELPQISRFIKMHRRHPARVVDPHAMHRRLRPLVEIELTPDLPPSLELSGLRAHDRLIVHLGPEVHEGALALWSFDVVGPSPDRLGPTGVFLGRLLEAWPGEDPSLRHVRVRLNDADPTGVELEAGSVAVECVVFNRPDLLTGLQVTN